MAKRATKSTTGSGGRPPEQLPVDMLDRRRPFTRADAVRAGVDPKILRTSRFRRIFRGVYVSAAVPVSPIVKIQAALALHPPDAFASHTSAADVFGLPVPESPDVHVSVLAAADRRPRARLKSHLVPAGAHVATYKGLRVSGPFQMFLELASLLYLVDLVVVADAMLRVFDIEAGRLVAECARMSGRHAAAARCAGALARDGVDSPMETRLRLLIVLAGLPEPTVNHTVRADDGEMILRFDLSYPELRLAVEYDGRQHAEDDRQWQRDLRRREDLDELGWRIIVVTATGLFRRPEHTLMRIRKALASRGCPKEGSNVGRCSTSAPAM